ncbi:MAG: hypothetical protein AB7T49_13070 [Oligoflexales bacterium]
MNVNQLFEQRANFYITPSSTVRGGMAFCLLLGILTVAYAFGVGQGTRFWGAYLFNLFFFFSLALGGVAFSAMQDVIGAVWGRPIKRLHEGFGAFIPVCTLLFVILLVAILANLGGARSVYRWIQDPSMVHGIFGKGFWLNEKFLIVRTVAALVAITLLTVWQLKQSLKRDLAFVQGNRDEALKLGQESKGKLRYWSGGVLVAYGVLFSMLGFDLIMSLSPLWYSTLFGGWQFSVMMQTLMATLLLIMFSLKNSPIGALIKRQQFHDVGKLMHGFTVFFAYLTYAHILTYWYGNIPEETEYFIHRLHGPWLYFVIGVPIFAFLIPLYGMIFKAAKWTAVVTIPMCLIILVAQWGTYLLLVMPEVVEGNTWNLPLIEIGTFVGFVGLFLATYFWFAKRFPMVGLADPLLAKSLQEHH